MSGHFAQQRGVKSRGPSSPSPASPSITPAKAQVSPVDQANDNPTSEAPPQSVFLPVGNDQQKQAPSSPPVPEPTAPPSSDFLPVGPHFAPASSAFLPVGAGSQNPQSSPNPPNPAQNPSNPQNPANTPVVILGGSQPTPGAQGGGNEQSGSQGDGGGQAGAQNGNTGQPGTQNGGSSQSGSQNDGNGQSGAQPGVNSQSSPGSPSPGAQPAGNTPGATDVVVDASGHTVAVGSQPSNGPAQTPAPVVNGAFQAGSQINSPITAPITGTAVGETYVIGTDGQIVIDGSTFNTATPTTATLKDGKTIVVGPSGAVSIQDKAPATTYMYTLSPLDYVLGGFLPIIVAVIFTAPWHILASAIKEIEPFYQLHKPDGALAEKSLGLTYRASITAVSTISAIKNKHYFVWWSGLLSSIALILAPMSSETIFIAFLGTASCNPMKSRDNCVPQLSVFPPAARVVQGVLAFMAILTLGLIIGLARARSGIYTNPLSIAALTSLFQDQRAIEDFRRIRAYYPPTPKELCEALRSKSYRIGPYYDLDGNERYGLHSTDDSAPNDPTSSFLPHSKHHTSVSIHKVDDDFQRPTKRRRQLIHIWTHSATVGIFSAFVIGLLALMIYYNRFPNPSSFEHFMESGSFGVNFLFTAVAVILKMYWTLLDDGSSPSSHPTLSPVTPLPCPQPH
ncbi:uncharacterized protein KY384_003952 [Bacidia gigantensis]|uniref:uncharacterized protein n=1 Tax=Bacidia gigantensis TaxID=2732470 RepID=UPI001D056452|nr:uncharacterized protein KY384_003952 [Bacidia gigantensis]KAG8532311.1 hypothetical protein KY384_003952 [Bacidia gigantensis]